MSRYVRAWVLVWTVTVALLAVSQVLLTGRL